jgi:hypothetical protein
MNRPVIIIGQLLYSTPHEAMICPTRQVDDSKRRQILPPNLSTAAPETIGMNTPGA